MKIFLILLTVLTIHPTCFAQTVLQDKKFTRVTKDNSESKNGAYASVTIDYLVRSLGKNEVFINTSVSDFSINSTQGFGYKGKVYRNEVPGLVQALDRARAFNPTVTFKIYYAANLVATQTASITAVNNLNGFGGDGFSIPATEEQIKNPNWTLEAVELKSFSLNPDWETYAGIISKYLQLIEDKDAYKKQINKADNALSSADNEAQLLMAKSEYNRALAISPNELYPKQKIENINDKISNLKNEEKKKQEDDMRKKQEETNAKDEEEKRKAEEERVKSEEKKKEPVKKEKKEITEKERDEMNERNRTASKFEVDGDELVYSNPTAAKQNYEQAQLINYTNRVEQKIKNLKTGIQVQSAFEAINGVDKLTDQLDKEGKTRFSEIFSGYDGIMANNDKLNKNYKSNPWNLNIFGTRISALFLALELRLGYFNSPYYEFEVRNTKDVDKVIDVVAIQQQAITTGLSGGLNFPFKNFCVYGLYGAEWVGLVTSKEIQKDKGYSFNEDDYPPKFPQFIFVLSTGVDFRIPKTKVGIGLRYNLNKVQIKPKDGNIKINGGADTRYQYFMNKISPEKVEYSNFGVRLIWNWN